jgi:hypothetical protein
MTLLPKYERGTTPPAMRFQERDGQILKAIREYDGVLAKRHLKAMFWPSATWRAMEMRLSLLYHQGYLEWPNALQWRTRPIPEPVCWLGWKGAEWLASDAGLETSIITNPSESKLRQLSRDLRKQGLRWQREPRWLQLQHDLAVVDFRFAVEKSVRKIPKLEVEKWLPESDFLLHTDTVEYVVEVKSHQSKSTKRGVRPDGYFALVDKQRQEQGLPCRARFLVEMDMATHDLTSFAIEKAIAGWHYIQSSAYKMRFGDNSGGWLVITTSDTRRIHLMDCVQRAIGADSTAFLFTTLTEAQQFNPLIDPIWWQVGQAGPRTLFKK